jgi:hypothetical protein
VLLCLAAKLLEFVDRLRQEQGEVFRPGLVAMLESVDLILLDAEGGQAGEWSSAERKALDRLRERTIRMCSDRELGAMARKLANLLNPSQ